MPAMQKIYPVEYLDWEKELLEERLGIASGKITQTCPGEIVLLSKA